MRSMWHPSTSRRWIWGSLSVQLAGLAFDFLWHGVLNPDCEAVTVDQMVTHLSTVHFPIYVGVLAVLLSTGWALFAQMRRSRMGIALPVAFLGALVSTAGEGWHAYTHLQLSTHSGPIAATTAFLGFVVVVAALWFSRTRRRRGAAHDVHDQPAA
jgi:FtsH-binding integral membrane protein